MGDEAIIDVADFTLDGPDDAAGPPGRDADPAGRLPREVVRHGDRPPTSSAELVELAERWRGAQTERGFSMALGRLGDRADARCVMVIARDAEGVVRGLLSFVPWGVRGLSLDLMRRDPDVGERPHRVHGRSLVDACGDLGVHRISLNFAMFREIFSDAEQVGAGPVLRLTNALLTVASRFWQLETLYLSNVKYLPRWSPRFICYARGGSLPQVRSRPASPRGFLPSPRPWTRSTPMRTRPSGTRSPRPPTARSSPPRSGSRRTTCSARSCRNAG